MPIDLKARLFLGALDETVYLVAASELGCAATSATDDGMMMPRRGQGVAVAAIVSMHTANEAQLLEEIKGPIDRHQT
jgi:hypothetical protein